MCVQVHEADRTGWTGTERWDDWFYTYSVCNFLMEVVVMEGFVKTLFTH